MDRGSFSALKEAILAMNNVNLRKKLSENGKRAAEERFTIEKMVDSYVGLLNEAR